MQTSSASRQHSSCSGAREQHRDQLGVLTVWYSHVLKLRCDHRLAAIQTKGGCVCTTMEDWFLGQHERTMKKRAAEPMYA